MPGWLLSEAGSPFPTCQSWGQTWGCLDCRVLVRELPLPVCAPEGTPFAPVRDHLHSLVPKSLKSGLFVKLCFYIFTYDKSIFIPKGQLVMLGDLQH